MMARGSISELILDLWGSRNCILWKIRRILFSEVVVFNRPLWDACLDIGENQAPHFVFHMIL